MCGFGMSWLDSLCLKAHMVGTALATCGATTKLVLLLKSKADPTYLPRYLASAKTITRLIVLGSVLLTLAGIGPAAWPGHNCTPCRETRHGSPDICAGAAHRQRRRAAVPGVGPSAGKSIPLHSFAFSDGIYCWRAQRPGFSTSSMLCGCWDDLRNCGPCEPDTRHV